MTDTGAERLLKTREVLERTGITHQVLYRYITLGLIEGADETRGGQRRFHPRVIALIEHIRGLNATGYSLRDIKDIFFKDGRVERACGADESPRGDLGCGGGSRIEGDREPPTARSRAQH